MGKTHYGFQTRREGGDHLGDPTLAKDVVAPEALLKMTEVEVVTLVWSLGQIDVAREGDAGIELTNEQKDELGKVLEQYEEVF